MALTVDVAGPAPWGFRITGGRDFHAPITVTKVTERSRAEAADLRPGDIIVAINGESAAGLLQAEAQSRIRQSPSPLRLQVDRSWASPGQTNGESPLELPAARFQGAVRARMPTESQHPPRPSYSSPTPPSPRAGSPFSSPRTPSPLHLAGEAVIGRSFQSPAHAPAFADRLSSGGCPGSRQAGLGRASDSAVLVLPPSPGARSRSPRPSVDSEGGGRLLEEDSEVLKMLQENREGRAAPRQSSSFRLLQEALEAEERGGTPVFLPSSLSPQPLQAPGRALATPPKLHTCEKCSSSIAPDSGPGPSSRPSPRPRLTPPLPQEPGRAHPGRALPPPRLLRVRRLRAEPQDARALLGGGRALLREARPPALLGVLGPQPAGLSALRPQPAG
ncbi:PDZ and LIM domain protein 2 isoform X2 [Dasypus novemcinctus]|uniref:PDZ and LIM domain protein 2 isoform X2 n=1 Tax=Dasypus novemcinctus TaxID=9361 RepID=UPI00265EF015|nr:PDZ and LIM domain protein 2 isoform X2 [Dasypus novemcinctus]XP_058146023.1 PDZ and LIM domain protein 2 isoform X2 [Dasypus novemcinctus]